MKRILLTCAAVLSGLALRAGNPVSEALPFTQINFSPASLAMASSKVASVATVPFGSYNGAAGFGFLNFMPEIDGTFYSFIGGTLHQNNVGASLAIVRGTGSKIDGENFTPSEIMVNAGFAWRFIPMLSAGVNVKYAKEEILNGYSYGAVAADLYLAGEYEDFDFAAGISDLGKKVGSEATGSFSLPAAVSLAGGWDHSFAEKHGMRLQAKADYFFSGAIAAAAGAEYSYDSTGFARLGYRYGGDSFMPSFASAGLGARFEGFAIDLNYIFASKTLGGSIGLSVSYSF